MDKKRSWQGSAGDNDVIGALAFGLADAHCGVTIQDRQLSYSHVFNLPECWEMPQNTTPSDVSIYGPHLGEKLALAKAALVATGEAQKLTTLAKDRVISFSIDLLDDSAASPLVITTIHDVTKARKREATLRTLLLELSHRSKNLMAIIQGLANQSAKYSPSLDGFLRAFIGRLHAISSTQDVLVDSNWQGASLFELAKRQLVLADADYDTGVEFVGSDIELDANQSMHIGMAMHELGMLAATPLDNSGSTRHVSLSVSIERVGGIDTAHLRWRSSPGAIEEPLKTDFGAVLLERVVPAAVSGVAKRQISDGAITWELQFPHRPQATPKPKKRRRPFS